MSTQSNSRRLVSTQQCASHEGVSERTIRNYIGKGYFPAYKMPGVRGLLVDLDEAESAMRKIPGRRAKAGTGSYGPNARIVRLPARPVVVDDGLGQ